MKRDRHFFKSAVYAGRLRLRRQPIVESTTQLPSRFEVLTTIVDGRDRVPAAEWIEAISHCSESMQLLDLNTVLWVLHEAPSTAQYWINLSPLSLQDGYFADLLIELIKASPVDPASLIFELTEHTPSGPSLRSACERLRELGCGLAVDDFGAGYNSALKLLELPFTALKLDGRLCQLAACNHRAYAVVKAFVAMAQAMKLAVVAEWVETATQQQTLAAMGVTLFQGRKFATPELAWESSHQNLAFPCANSVAYSADASAYSRS